MLPPSRVRAALLAAGLLLPSAAFAQESSAKLSTKTPPAFQLSLAPEATVGGTYRLNDAASGYPIDERFGANYDLGLYLGLGRRVDVGVHYLHTHIGVENESNVAQNNGIESRRALDAALLTGRFFAFRNDWAGIFLGLTAGLGWQSVDHRASLVQQSGSSPVFTKVRCQASGSASLGLGVGLGAQFEVDKGTEFLIQFAGMNNQGSSDTLKDGGVDCASGSGSSTLLMAQMAFRYRFDLGGSSKDAR